MQNYTTQLVQLYEKGAWFGDTYSDKLADVTEKDAFQQPHGLHSIAELISHVTYWRKTLIKGLKKEENPGGSTGSDDNWTEVEVLKKKGWKKILQEFESSQQELIALLDKAKPAFFQTEFSPGSTMEYVTEGVIQHDVYHLGQLGLVKKLLKQ